MWERFCRILSLIQLNLMSISHDLLCLTVTLTMLFAAVFYVATGMGSCRWTISSRYVFIEVAFWQFSNNPPSSASMDDAMTSLMILHSTYNGPFYGGISWIGVLEFGHRKNIFLLCFVPPVLICGIHRIMCGESFCFFCILLLCLDVFPCNL